VVRLQVGFLLGLLLPGWAADPPSGLVEEQLSQIRPALERHKADYAKKVKAENDKLCKALETALTKQVRAGDLDSANALKAALEQARAGEFIEELLNPPAIDLLGESGGPPRPLLADLPEASFTSSSVWTGNILAHGPARARVATSSWIAQTNDANQWIQVDFGREVQISAIAIRGRPGIGQWVTAYRLLAGRDERSLRPVPAAGGAPAVFDGSKDSETEVTTLLPRPLRTRFLRLVPISWNGHISMRLDVQGTMAPSAR